MGAMLRVGGCWAAAAVLPLMAWAAKAGERPVYLNPSAVVADAAGGRAYVALSGAGEIAVVNLKENRKVASWKTDLPPQGLALSPDRTVLAVVMGEGEGRLALLGVGDGRVRRQWAAGFSPAAPAFMLGGKMLAVASRHAHRVGFYAAGSGARLGAVACGREPVALVPSADGRRIFVGTYLPGQPATAEHVACTVEVIDAARRRRIRVIDLPNGSSGLHGLAASPDGKWILATHILGHYQVPTNQLERGWMNANALTVIDAEQMEVLGTALLDDTTLGAANPWGVAVTADGGTLVVAHAGTHEASIIPFAPLLDMLRAGRQKSSTEAGAAYGVERDLTVMQRAGRIRLRMPGEGPRQVAMAGRRALVLEYFSGRMVVLDLAQKELARIQPQTVALGEEPPMDTVRKGELRFSDARLCFQAWQSCISCHPAVRADGLNWDLLNDGIGNPKQTKSMVFSHATPPAMGHGIRASAEVAVRAGIRFIQFAEVVEEQATAIDAYLKSLRPLPSPYLVKGELSARAREGREIFNRIGCADCHTGPYFTDLQSYKIRHAAGQDAEREFDTPTLIEAWRTGPYLYDGRAATMEEALRIKSKWTQGLGDEELRALAEYVLSL